VIKNVSKAQARPKTAASLTDKIKVYDKKPSKDPFGKNSFLDLIFDYFLD